MAEKHKNDHAPAEDRAEAPACGARLSGAALEEHIRMRVLQKVEDYRRYEFPPAQSRTLNIFFDLVQEFESEEDFHAVCVMVPKVILGFDAALFLLTPSSELECAYSTMPQEDAVCRSTNHLPSVPSCLQGRFCAPIRGNRRFIDQLPFAPKDDVIGYLEVDPKGKLTPQDQLFLEKFANRIGFQQHLRMIHGANHDHLQFIRNLVKDIGHNVIVPNMYFKLYFNRLRRRIDELGELVVPECGDSDELHKVHQNLLDQYDEIARHYEQTSLYLETLLRQSHFEKGHYVLERRTCHLPSMIIDPQLAQNAGRFRENAIRVEQGERDAPDEALHLQVDVGLMAQVFSNLFSNAAKYAEEVDGTGKRLVVGWHHLPEAFGADADGVCFRVGSSGHRVAEADSAQLFEAGYRGQNSTEQAGTGHGLYFVRQIVELHGGKVWYEHDGGLNTFVVVLPVPARTEEAGS